MPLAALHEILEAADFDPGQTAQISGEDPVLPIRYRVATAATASLAALGLAVARLWTIRGGNLQGVSVNARAAAISLRSTRYLRVDGKPPPPVWDPLSGFYPVRVLGAGPDRARAAIRRRAGCKPSR